MTEKCENCYYGRQVSPSEVECHRHAPKPGNLNGLPMAWWPSVTTKDWCGEWREDKK